LNNEYKNEEITVDQIEYHEEAIKSRHLARNVSETEIAELTEMASNEYKEITAAKFAWTEAKTNVATQRREVRKVTNIRVHSSQYGTKEINDKERKIELEPWTMQVNSLVESDKLDDGDDDDDGVGLEKADGNTENNIEDNVSSADDTDGAEELESSMNDLNAVLAKILEVMNSFMDARDKKRA